MIDTARIYQQATPEGDTETVLGEALKDEAIRAAAELHTKANPMMPPHKCLSRESIVAQCNASLQKLGVSTLPIFYLHSPDINTDLEDTLSGIDELHKAGKIKEFGLSNYPAWVVVDIWHRCKSRGIVRPTVYQGVYNLITRDMERELVPVVRELGLRLYMFNPLAGGLLSGRYRTMEDVASATEGRFSQEFDHAFGKEFQAGMMYRKRYNKESNFKALEVLGTACEKAKLSMADVALRWMIHHSLLGPDDGIIMGVSKPEHLEANLKSWGAGPLPAEVAQACEEAWEIARPFSEGYFRGYGVAPGGIELFLAKKAKEREEPQAKRARV